MYCQCCDLNQQSATGGPFRLKDDWNQLCRENSTGEGSETGSDWMHLSNRKKIWAESVQERVAGEGLELLADLVGPLAMGRSLVFVQRALGSTRQF